MSVVLVHKAGFFVKTTRVGKSSDPYGIKAWLKYLLPVAICNTK